LDFKEIFEILAANNNEAPLSIEIEFTEAGPADLEAVNQAVQDSYNYLKELGIDF
jgi:sugar phosphate isomerase/epimerase